MAATTLNDLVYALREYWANDGLPAEMWSQSGDFAKMVKKRVKKDWTGTGQAKMPAQDRISGNQGPNYSRVYQSVSSGGVQYLVNAKDHFAFMTLDGRMLEFATSGSISGTALDGPMLEANNTISGLMRSMSYLLWSDGTGRIAKGDGAYSVAGNVITFMNSASALQFEVGDRLVLIDPAAPVPASGMPAYRALAVADTPMVVTARDEDAGTITVSANVSTTIPTATNADYIGKWQYFDSAYGIIDGVFRWIPITRNESLTTWAGVDRSVDPSRRAGKRILLDGSESPYSVIGKLGNALKRAKGGISDSDEYAIFVPASKIEELTAEAGTQGITFRDASTDTDVSVLTMGVSHAYALWPGLGKVQIHCDHFLHDPNLTADQDTTYALLNLADWDIRMGRTGLDWKAYEDGGGMVKQKPGLDEYFALFGARMNAFCRSPGHQIIGSTRAED